VSVSYEMRHRGTYETGILDYVAGKADAIRAPLRRHESYDAAVAW
jgi:hypothetical protein